MSQLYIVKFLAFIAHIFRKAHILGAMKQLTLLLAFSLSLACYAQKPVADYLQEGDNALNNAGPYLAEQIYGKATKEYPNDLTANYKYGTTLLIINEYLAASEVLKHAYMLDGEKKFPDIISLLAKAQKSAGLFEEALESYELIYTQTSDNPRSKEHRRAAVEISSLKRIISGGYEGNPNPIRNLDNLNSEESDFAPLILSDELMLYSKSLGVFADVNGFDIKIHKSSKKKDEWKSGAALSATLNKRGYYAANPAFSADSSELFFSLCGNASSCKIYSAKLNTNFDISTPRPIPLSENHSLSSHPYPFVSKEGREGLLYTVKTDSSGYDIYLSWKDEEGKHSQGQALGDEINSPEDEISPFYLPEKDLLFFSSSYHGGMGAQDIFYCYTEDLKNFSRLINLKGPYNSPANDSYFTLDKSLNYGLLVSNREGGKKNKYRTCCNDIYDFQYPFDSIHGNYEELMAEMKDTISYLEVNTAEDIMNEVYSLVDSLRDLLPIPLYFHNDEPHPKSLKRESAVLYDKTYHEYLALREEYLNTNPNGQLAPFFDETLPQSFERFNQFIKLLNKLQNITPYPVLLSVRGYASPLAKSDYNVFLSERRISSVEQYMFEQFDGQYDEDIVRLVANPFGESKSAANVSDDYSDKKSSIYSLGAMLERRVEVQWLQLDKSRILRDSVKEGSKDLVKTLFFPVGRIAQNNIKKAVIALYNPFDQPFSIGEIRGACDCVEWHLERYDLNKSAALPIELKLMGKGNKGERQVELMLYPTQEDLPPIRVVLGVEIF